MLRPVSEGCGSSEGEAMAEYVDDLIVILGREGLIAVTSREWAWYQANILWPNLEVF